MSNNIEPLTLTLWFHRIAVMAAGELGSVENSLRHASHLVQLAPEPFRRVLPSILDEDRFEALLESGDLDAAARQLIVPPTVLLVETSAVDKTLHAVIGCALLKQPVDGKGETVASAILDAWANWLITLRLEYGGDLEDDPVPVGIVPTAVGKRARRRST